MATVQMPEYQDNSETAKREAVKDAPTPHKKEAGELRKRPAVKKMGDAILPKEDRREIADYAIFDIILPAVKETISTLVSNTIDMMLFGQTRGGYSSKSGNKYTNYNSKYSSKGSSRSKYEDDDRRDRRNRGKDIDDIVFNTYAAADRVYQTLLDYIDEYDYVRVSDLFDEAGVTVPDWTYDSYGWDDLPPKANIERVRDHDDNGRPITRYALVMPKPYRLGRR